MDLQKTIARAGLAGIPDVAVGHLGRGTRTLTGGASRFRIASLTKVFTATATVRALRDRHIPLDTPVRDLLPALAPDWHADPALTIEQVLGQVSGLRESVDAAAAAALGGADTALLEAARLVVRAGSERAPGERWSYYNGNYFLAGAVLAALRGTTYEDALTDGLLTPWQLTETGFDTSPAAVPGRERGAELPETPYPRTRRPSGGLRSTAGDLLTLTGQLLADRPLLDEIRRPRTRAGDPMTYGLAWAVGPSGQLYLNGRLAGYRAAAVLLPDHDTAAVALAADTDALPSLACLLSDLQHPLTGDGISKSIDAFAA